MGASGVRGAGPRRRPERFPGERTWRFHVQLRVEGIIAPARAVLVLANAVVWLSRPHPPGSMAGLAAVLIALSWAYVASDLVLRTRWQPLAERVPYASVLLDMAFVGLWVLATGGRQSAFTVLILAGAASGPLRLSFAGGLLVTAYYSLLALIFGRPPGLDVLLYTVLVTGMSGAFWTRTLLGERRSALRDPLTGTFGREYGLFRLRQILKQRAFPASVALIDLDRFKEVNDTMGHLAGDEVLQQVARALIETTRTSDLVARYGGDEFLVIWPGKRLPEAREAAARIREQIGRVQGPRQGDRTLSLGASIGIVEALGPTTVTDLIRRADEDLYRQKESPSREPRGPV